MTFFGDSALIVSAETPDEIRRLRALHRALSQCQGTSATIRAARTEQNRLWMARLRGADFPLYMGLKATVDDVTVVARDAGR